MLDITLEARKGSWEFYAALAAENVRRTCTNRSHLSSIGSTFVLNGEELR